MIFFSKGTSMLGNEGHLRGPWWNSIHYRITTIAFYSELSWSNEINPSAKESPSDSNAIDKTALTITGTHSHLMSEKCEVFNNETCQSLIFNDYQLTFIRVKDPCTKSLSNLEKYLKKVNSPPYTQLKGRGGIFAARPSVRELQKETFTISFQKDIPLS